MKPIVHMIIATLFFSFMELCVKSLPRISTEQIVFFRAAVAMVICLVMIRQQKISLFGNNKKILLLRGIFGTMALIIYFYTIKEMPLATASTIQKLSPLFTVIFAFFLRKEAMAKSTWFYFLLAFIGVLVLKGPSADIPIGIFSFAIFAAVSSALAYNCVAHLGKTDHPLTVIFYFPLVTIPVIAYPTYEKWIWPTPYEWGLLILVGVVVQIAQYYMTLSFQEGASAKVSIIYYLGTVLAVIYGWTIFSEVPTLMSLLGISIILLAVIQNSRTKVSL